MVYLVATLVFLGLVLSLVLLLMIIQAVFAGDKEASLIVNKDNSYPVEPGSSLLTALSHHDIFIPSACGGKGSCGMCKVESHSHSEPLPQELPYLTRDERKKGVRLSCQVKVNSAMDVQIPEALLNAKRYRAKVTKANDVTYDIKELRFELLDPQEIKFRAGDYIQIIVPEYHEEFRAYSVSNSPYETDAVEVMIRLVPNGLCSTYAHCLEVGDEITFTGPYGEFELDESEDTELILVGGGVGMPPIKSLALYATQAFKRKKISMFFGCRAVKDMFYYDYFKKLEEKFPNFKVYYALSDLDPDDKWDGPKGFVHLTLDEYMAKEGRRQAFLCGPVPMINAVTKTLRKNGLSEKDIFWDDFGL